MNQLIEFYENFDRKINIKRDYQALTQDAQSFIKFYLNFIRFNDSFDIDEDTLLKKLFKKLIIRLKMLYDTRENFIVLKEIKEYLLKLNNNQ